MQALATDPKDAVIQLEALAHSDRLPARDAARCAQLVDTLRKPVRVCLLGPAGGDLRAMLDALVGQPLAPEDQVLPPAIELRHGTRAVTRATLEDGAHLTSDGWPDAEMLAKAPVFLQLELPLPTLARMSFLALSLDVNPAMHRPALSWAARRAEIAVWFTSRFSVADARIWGNAPERLTHHAYLVETRPCADTPRHGAMNEFTGRLHLPLPLDIDALLAQLNTDIDEARVADVDAAHLLLHRLGHLGDVAGISGIADKGLLPEPGRSPGQLARLRQVLSEPILYLAQRARSLAEDLTWTAAETDPEWAANALAHCSDTLAGLRDRADAWPDDLPEFASLQFQIEACADLIVLLQMEAGPDQAEDAAGLLLQMREALNQTIAGKGVPK